MNPIDTWVYGQWGFFTLIQSLIVCFQRFKVALSSADITAAKTEFSAATNSKLNIRRCKSIHNVYND